MKAALATACTLAIITIFAAELRFKKLNWDEGHLSHPDDRFMSMVTEKISFPSSLEEYFDSRVSPLNPKNHGYQIYVYGTLPLFIAKAATQMFGVSDLRGIAWVGRCLSAIYDTLTVLAIFILAWLICDVFTALLAAFVSASTVLMIQHAHFFVVEPLLVFFMTCSLIGICRIAKGSSLAAYVWTCAALGLALSTKISAIVLLPAVFLAFALDLKNSFSKAANGGCSFLPCLVEKAYGLLLSLTVMFLLVRVLQPYAFAPGSFISLNPAFIADLEMISKVSTPSARFPPSVQWHDRSPAYGMINTLLWGMGLPLGILAGAGFLYFCFQLVKNRRDDFLIPIFVVSMLCLYYSLNFVQPMRYFLPIYPLLIVMAANFCVLSVKRFHWKGMLPIAVLVFSHIAWMFAFTSHYRVPFPRSEAMKWMKQHIAPGSTIAQEHWDELFQITYGHNTTVPYKHIQLKIFDADSIAKRDALANALFQTDYLILNSQRGYATITRWPAVYPYASAYYERLFTGQLGFELAKSFRSGMDFLGWRLCPQLAEESFTVYDRAPVLIFQKKRVLTENELRTALSKVAEPERPWATAQKMACQDEQSTS